MLVVNYVLHRVSIRYIAVLGFQHFGPRSRSVLLRKVSIRYIAVLGFQQRNIDVARDFFGYSFHPLYRGTWFPTGPVAQDRPAGRERFPSAISRYLVSNPTSKTPPLTSGGGNGLHTTRRIDHIPTFASLNSNKNTRSTHYTPNAGIELSETTPPPLRVNPVQNWI